MSDVDLPQVYTISKPTARKDHKCCECRGIIKAGEKYQLYKGLWDGEFQTYKTCLDCLGLRDSIDMEPCESIAFCELCEFIFEGDDDDLKRKYIEIRRKRGVEVTDWMLESISPHDEGATTNERNYL